MANIKESERRQQCQNSNVARVQKYLQTLRNFVTSDNEVYMFEDNMPDEECAIVDQLCQNMGLGSQFIGSENGQILSVYKIKEEDSNLAVTPKKRKKEEKPELPQHQNPIVDESTRIRISQILESFFASNDEVYSFEANLSGEECSVVHDLSLKMGFSCSFSGRGIKRKISVHKTKKEIDTTVVLESLPHLTFSVESNQVGMPTETQNKEEPEPPQHQNLIVDESTSIWIFQTLKNFLASKDEVYKVKANLSGGERSLMHNLCQKMGLSCKFYGRGTKRKISLQKIKKEVDTSTLLETFPHFSFSEESNMGNKQKKEVPEPYLHQNPTVDESTRSWISQTSGKRQKKEPKLSRHQNPIVDESILIRISQILETFLVSKDASYNFEANLSPEECVVVHQLSRKMGFQVRKSGRGIKEKISVHKTKKTVGTTTEIESLPHFNFSEESKQALGGLLMHYPPGDEEFRGEMIGTNSGTTYLKEQMADDFFGRPHMTKDEVAKNLEDVAARMKNPSDLKPMIEKRSKLPIASFKDDITLTIESHQVVLISGETGCGKTTQVPQFILDHIWGKGEVCKIVCTQPRRISAISVSERISKERGEHVGNNVGYKIRLESRGGRQSSIVLCTTGVLLKVLLSKGSGSIKDGISGITHIIMDEIHERDRYSDLMLAILREMLPSYPHIHLILMSATIDTARFSQYFGDCPTIHVPGFTYPVKTFYLEDVLSIVKSRDHLDNNRVLSQEEKLALDEAINLAWSNDDWCPLLELICSEGSPKVTNYQHSVTGVTPLMVSAGKGTVSYMCMLLSLGADCHLRDKDGTTALEIAEKENQQGAAEMLKKHMDNDFSNKEGKNLLDNYLATVNPELVDIVLIEQLIRKICIDSKDGGILVFLPGWDEINRTRERLLASPFFNDTAKFMVLSLHSMVPLTEQRMVFGCLPQGCRKIVLSTNIAETAVTIDDVVYVIDTGRMKEKNYDPYSDVSTLESSWVSKASAKQRAGRAGRCQPGICYHLYSKVRAASLPDFCVPEIRRMPIEELCLQVKLLDPSRKIEEFLSKTLDPPVLKSIQNAIAVLQEIGALSLDEKLTQLGVKLGSLPVHPSTSRMLLFAILMKCLDPALTLACASEYRDPFTLPILPDEKKRAAASRSELASLYGGCGDQFAVIAAFECWQNSKRMDLEARFCSQYFISPSTMKMLSGMRKKLVTELFRTGLIHNDVSSYCMNSHDPGIVHAVLVAGMYPMVGKLRLPNERGKRFIVKTERGDKVRLNSHSTIYRLSSEKSFDCSLVVYDEITRNDWGMNIRNCTVVGPLPLLVLSTEIAVAPAKDCNEGDKLMSSPDDIVRVIIDRWLELESTALDVSHIYYLRERLLAAISYKVTHSTDVLPPTLGATMNTLARILSCDGLSGMPRTSDGADTPTTTVNEASLGKPATEKEQVSSDQASQDALGALACSTSTEQMGMNPEGSCNALIMMCRLLELVYLNQGY